MSPTNIVKKVMIQGAEYTLASTVGYSETAGQYVILVKRANGGVSHAFSKNANGPFTFKDHLEEVCEDVEPIGNPKVAIIRDAFLINEV